MKHLRNFYEMTYESEIAIKDTTKVKFNTDSLIQVVDENDKNLGQAKIKSMLKNLYNVIYKGNTYKIDKKDLSLNINGQVQTELKNLKGLIKENFGAEIVYEGKSSDVERVKDGIMYRGEKFPGFNKPKSYSGPGKFKKRVLAKEGDKIKVLNYGHKDYKDFTQHKDTDRRKNFRSRMNCDPVSSLSKLSKKYWACQDLW